MNKCQGCGIESKKKYCERCFRLKHYQEFQASKINENDFLKIINEIPHDAHVVLVVDVLNIPQNFEKFQQFKNITLVLSKRDQLSKDIADEKLLTFFNQDNFARKIVVSSFKNHNLDQLYAILKKYPKTYFVGYVNSGKSTLINKIIYNYTDLEIEVTTSIMPATTQAILNLQVTEDLQIIDTPGLFGDSLYSILTKEDLKKLVVHKPIKPTVYQIKEKQTLVFFDNFFITINKPNDIIFYFSNQISLRRIYQDLALPKQIEITEPSDLVILGIGFINIKKPGIIKYQIPKQATIFVRQPLI